LSQDGQAIATFLEGIPGTKYFRWISKDSAFNYIAQNNVRSTVVKPTDTGNINYSVELTLIDTNYPAPRNICIEKFSKDIVVLPALVEVPNIFTPNGDGKNDFFKLIKKGEVNIKEMRIYNRWGEMVHNDPNTPWDGNFKGQPQPSGTYLVYVFYTKPEVKAPIRDVPFMEFPITLIR
jgi:gliding motility-associated-like protein